MNPMEDLLWAIFYESDAYSVTGDKVMGRQAAGNSLLKAYARSNFDKIGAYTRNDINFNDFKNVLSSFLRPDQNKEVSKIPWGSPDLSNSFGGIYYPAPDISRLANQRFFYGHHNYSIVGVTHTTASETVINSLIECYTSPLYEWDSIICTSNSVKNSINTLYEQYHNILKNRLGATKKPNFLLPVIPLGVHCDDYNFDKSETLNYRNSLGIKENDIVLLFLGRLSFHAKAHHLPMYIALEEVAKKLPSDINLHLLQTGWFPNDFIKEIYEEDSKKIAPSVNFLYLDGRIEKEKLKSYQVSDIFISLVDNFQETFGLTPLEGMASGLPVIVSDWNGYKDTVRDTIDGFRIKTTTMEPGHGYKNALRHNFNFDTYDHYIGRTSQTVSIDINEVIEKVLLLATNKDLRKSMSIEAKKRSKDFDWLKILDSYLDLKIELDKKREFSKKNKEKTFFPPINIQDQYTYFSDYSTSHITKKTIVENNKEINKININKFVEFKSINFIDDIVPPLDKIIKINDYIIDNGPCSISSIMTKLSIPEGLAYRIILWLAKYGYSKLSDNND
ncbi:MAG: hypothetical protein CMC33_01670 [Flavobacteriaceae bacterium]|nr:hypothetical protein [Flavobacteriaceae bacterium]